MKFKDYILNSLVLAVIATLLVFAGALGYHYFYEQEPIPLPAEIKFTDVDSASIISRATANKFTFTEFMRIYGGYTINDTNWIDTTIISWVDSTATSNDSGILMYSADTVAIFAKYDSLSAIGHKMTLRVQTSVILANTAIITVDSLIPAALITTDITIDSLLLNFPKPDTTIITIDKFPTLKDTALIGMGCSLLTLLLLLVVK